jgi:hypothetical protein
MSVLQLVLGWLGVLQLFALFFVLVYRRHYERMPLFTLFAGGIAVSNAMVGLHHTWETWMVHQVATAALRLGVALELTRCIFGAFPAAATTARRVLLAILVITAFTAISASRPDAVYTRMHAESIPRLASGAVWMLTALAGLVLWYRLPLAPLPRAILMGYAPYLLIFAIGMSLLFDSSWQHVRQWVGYIDTLAYITLVGYWIRVAWRTAPESTMPYRLPSAMRPDRPEPGRVT